MTSTSIANASYMKVNNAAAPLSDLTVADAKITNLTVGNLLVENLTITSLADERIASMGNFVGYAPVPAVLARRIGNVVFVAIQLENLGGAAIPGVLGTLSAPFRPAATVTEVIPTTSVTVTVTITAAGVVSITTVLGGGANIQQPSALVYPAAV